MGNRTTGRRVGTGQLYMTSEMRLEVLTALNIKIVALLGVAPCSLVQVPEFRINMFWPPLTNYRDRVCAADSRVLWDGSEIGVPHSS
jgi:hypothetical protein